MRAGVDVVYQGVFAHDGWRGVADFLLRQPDGTYEALDTKLARTAKPAYILQLLFYNEQLARVQGREPEHIHVLLGNGEQQSFRPQEFAAYYRRVRSRLERFVADPPPTEPYPVDHCSVCDFKPRLRRVLGLGRPPLPRRRALPDADREARRRGDHDARAAGTRAGRARAGRDPRRHLGEAARAGRAPAPRARDRRERLPPPRAAARERLLAPARPLAGRPLLRLRGQPVLGQGREPRVPLGDPRRRAQLHAAARTRPRDGAARVRDVRRPRARAARSSTRSCTSTTTRPTRSPRSSASWAATARARRSSTTCFGAASSSTSTRSSATASAPRGPATG